MCADALTVNIPIDVIDTVAEQTKERNVSFSL